MGRRFFSVGSCIVLIFVVGTLRVVALLLSSVSFVNEDGILVVAFDGGGRVVVSVENPLGVWCVRCHWGLNLFC